MHKIVYTTKPDPKSLPGYWEPKVIPDIDKCITSKKLDGFDTNQAVILENVLNAKDCQSIINLMMSSDNFEEVGVQGMMDKKDEHIGSVRTSVWSPEIAEIIWNKIRNCSTMFGYTLNCDKYTATDWWQGLTGKELSQAINNKNNYKPIALSPLLRFMRYEKGGQHFAHYDAGFIYPNNKFRTLKSFVLYLTTNDGAATRFIDDKQKDKPIWEREHNDFSRPATEDEIIGKSECIAGNMLIFNHRICHDVEQYLGNQPRMIIRGDIVYEQIP